MMSKNFQYESGRAFPCSTMRRAEVSAQGRTTMYAVIARAYEDTNQSVNHDLDEDVRTREGDIAGFF